MTFSLGLSNQEFSLPAWGGPGELMEVSISLDPSSHSALRFCMQCLDPFWRDSSAVSLWHTRFSPQWNHCPGSGKQLCWFNEGVCLLFGPGVFSEVGLNGQPARGLKNAALRWGADANVRLGRHGAGQEDWVSGWTFRVLCLWSEGGSFYILECRPPLVSYGFSKSQCNECTENEKVKTKIKGLES
jgi:hypothetical protein